jgi:hypothetical protein
MAAPKDLVEKLEQGAELPGGNEERFVGYGVMGVPFTSGHLLAMRRFPASSLGVSYTSVWHRDPQGKWTFYTDVPPQLACPRYFGSAVAEAVVRGENGRRVRERHSEDLAARGLVREDLLDIRAGIKAGRYVNEATVSQGIVQRLLNALGWPVYDTEVVAPEYSLGTRRARRRRRPHPAEARHAHAVHPSLSPFCHRLTAW